VKRFFLKIVAVLKKHVVWMAPEKDNRTDSKGGGVGFRWNFWI